MQVIIATIKSWNISNAIRLKEESKDKFSVHIISDKSELNFNNIQKINPDFIFFPHWSYIIPQELYENYNCVVFHMTDLPFGRGGSPLQNLIDYGLKETKISAIKVNDGIDTGDIYLKSKLSLYGTADEIFMRSADVIFKEMIPNIINNNIIAYKQVGKVVEFRRRRPEQSEIKAEFELNKIYDYIRMLDGEGYPKAFVRFGQYRLEFSRASLKNGKIIADVEIVEEGDINE